MRCKLNRVEQRLGHDLTLQQVHSEVRDLWLVENSSPGIRRDRTGYLLGSVADVLPSCEERVELGVVIDHVRIDALVRGVHGKRRCTASPGDVQILHRREELEIFEQVSEKRVDA